MNLNFKNMKKLFIHYSPSPPVLRKILEETGLEQDEIEDIIKNYPDVKSIIDADPKELAKNVGIDEEEAKNLQIFIKKRISGNKVGTDFLKRWGRVSSDANLKSSYEEYERLSKLYPNSPIVWEIKGETLEKMGRFKEAEKSYEKAYKLYLQRGEMPPENLIEKLKREKKDRSFTKVKGLSNGLGTINGFKNGFRNGLINGKGIVNGSSISSSMRPIKDVGKILIPLFIVFIIIAAPLLGVIFFEKHYIFKVDGNFQEWKSEMSYYGLKSPKSSINIRSVKFHPADNGIFFYIHPQEDIFKVSTGIYIFLDIDSSSSTGYLVKGLGADYMIELYGWNSSVVGKALYIFNGTDQYDFLNFRKIGGANVIYKDQKIEGFVSLPYKEFRAIAISYDYTGNEALAPCPHYGKNSFLVIEEKYASLLKENDTDVVTKMELIGNNIQISSINFTFSGTAKVHNLLFSLYLDDGNGIFDSGDSLISTTNYVGGILKFQHLNLNLNNSTLFLTVYIKGTSNSEKTIKIEVSEIDSPKDYFIDNRIEDATYIGKIPSMPTIDGSFEDWKNISTDPMQDVISSNGSMKIDAPNIDILHYGSFNDRTLYLFMDVRGKLLGGADAPTKRFPSLPDSDGDSVPDILDPYPYDFNNDGVPDNKSYVVINDEKLPDVDGDGIADYPQGNDMWLNTTIPSWFPSPYANRVIHKYIGPVPAKKEYGIDTITIYINSDNDIRTGFSLPQYPMGADYMIEIYGKDGKVLNSSLYTYQGARWIYKKTLTPFLGYHGMELNTSVYSSSTSTFIFISDWKGDKDSAGNTLQRTRNPTEFNFNISKSLKIEIKYENSTVHKESLASLRADFGTDVQVTFSNGDENRAYIARTKNGVLWTVFDTFSGFLSFANSTDNGESWTVYTTNIRGEKPVIFADSSNNVYIFYENHTATSNFTYLRIDSQGAVHIYMYAQTSWWKHVYNLSVAYLSADAGHVYIAFDYYYNSYYYLGYIHSNDSGLNWEGSLLYNLTDNPGNPCVAISSGSQPKTFIAFEYYYSNSIWVVVVVNNSGVTSNDWSINKVLYGNTNEGYRDYRHPSIFSYDDRIYLTYEALSGTQILWFWIPSDWDIKFISSIDNGDSWSTESIVADGRNNEVSPWVISDGDSVYLFYIDKSSNRRASVIMKKSNDNGETWGDTIQIDDENNVSPIYHAVSAIYSGGGIYVVWTDGRNGNDDIYFDKIPEFNELIIPIIATLSILLIMRKRERKSNE